MKTITITTEIAENLLTNLSALKGKQNHVRFSIGKKQLKDGLASQAVIVNGNQMAEIGFKTSFPKEKVEIAENEPFMSFNLLASDFCDYMSVLKTYNSDISISYNGKTVTLSIGDQVSIPLNTIPDSNMEPLLVQDFKNALAQIEVEADDFIQLLRKGCFAVGSNELDSRAILDRWVLKLSDAKCFAYSTDSHTIAKSWCASVNRFNDAQRALYYLKTKGGTYSKNEQETLMNRMKGLQTDPQGMIDLAIEKGFVKEDDLMVSLPGNTVPILQKLYNNAGRLLIMVTPNNFHIQGGNVLSTMSLAGTVSPMYKSTVDKWEDTAWDARVVVDKEEFVRALNILKLSGDNTPFQIEISNNQLSTSKDGNIINTVIIAQDVVPDTIHAYLSVSKVLNILSRMSNGNIILRLKDLSEDSTCPISISNGDLEEQTLDSYSYVFQVSMPEPEADTGECEGTETSESQNE